MNRFDAMTPRVRKDGKTFWHRVGTAFQKDDGKISIVFDSLPMPDAEGRCTVHLFEPRDKTNTPGDKYLSGALGPEPRQNSGENLDDEIPF